jgi:alkanesulfonate monooxygenase SsuD/methylene tetrahydromethanopterin reductase-like flavin-dependent oxidoreductase (luciferase family)
MKFGTFHIIQWHESKTQAQSIKEALEQIELADELGFDAAWIGEHHFSRHGLVSGIFPLLGSLAARTKRIKIGSAVVVLPFHNPILVAQEAATLDILSDGRLLLGVGSGYQRQEFEGLGLDVEEARDRFREYLDVIIEAWSGRPEDKMTYHGKFVDVEDLWTMPKPVQKPHPPLYIAVSTSPETVDFAASKNFQIIVGGPTAVMGQAPDVVKLWHTKMEEHGHRHDHLNPPVSMGVYVAPTMEEAEQDPHGLDDFSTKVLAQIGSPIGKDGRPPKGYEHWANRQRDRQMATEAARTGGMPKLYGTPEVVAERLEAVRGMGIKHIISNFGFPGLPHEKTMRSLELFATHVMPHFKEVPTGATAG